MNLIGQPTSCATPEGDWSVNYLIIFVPLSHLMLFINRLEDVLSPYDDLSFLMYTDSEVTQQILCIYRVFFYNGLP